MVRDTRQIVTRNLPRGERGGLRKRDDSLLDGPVDSLEVDDHIALLESQVAEDRIDARRRVVDKDAFISGYGE
ncbi:hypothetical protein MAP00_005978 [Monascus purpureus]|nr:hypothetical protein MAP00_005978 [Monascus purpureus]